MKKSILFCSALAVSLCTQAQTSPQTAAPILKGQQRLNSRTMEVLSQQFPATANKGNGISDRLIGYAGYYGGLVVDTARFKYSGGRGSNLNNNIYATYTDQGFVAPFNLQYPYPSPLAMERSKPSLMFDTGYVRSDWGGGVYLEYNVSRQYGTNTLTDVTSMLLNFGTGTMGQRQKSMFQYNGSNKVTVGEIDLDTTTAMNGAFFPYAYGYYKYNSAGAIVQDSFIDASIPPAAPIYNVLYTYDASGNMTRSLTQSWIGTSWIDYSTDSFLYTGNKLSVHLYSEEVGAGQWVGMNVDSFQYSGNNVIYNSSYERNTSTGAWTNGSRTYSHYNAANNLDSQAYYEQSSATVFDPININKYKYTSYGHFDSVLTYYYNGTVLGTIPDNIYKYYYETYTPSSVRNVALSNANTASLFPNPAKDVLHIRFKEAPAAAMTFAVYNMTGQLLQRTSGAAGSTYDIPAQSLMPGNYILEVSEGNGSQRLPFVKL